MGPTRSQDVLCPQLFSNCCLSVQVQPELALRVASATLAATRTLREGSALSMDAQERIYLETLLRRMLVSTTLRGAQPWTLAEGGALAGC